MSHEVYREIRRLIAEGDYLGGDALPEVELAERLGVSRTPVREALGRLQAEGVVVRRDNRRVYLAEMDPAHVVEIFTIRAALESIAARVATPRVDAAFLERMETLVALMETARTRTPPDLRSYRELNEELHWSILALAGDVTLEETVRSVSRRPAPSPTFNDWTAEELARSQQQHRELLAAFRAGDADWAEAIMRTHLLAARASFMRILALSRC
jgi:DNA-binding GntR family transcriptional regulator